MADTGASSPRAQGSVGLLYDGIHQAKAETREWLLIPGESEAGRGDSSRPDGRLWRPSTSIWPELRAVDHPADVAIVPDDGSSPRAKALYTIAHPFVPAAIEKGRITEEIARKDGRYLAGFAPTRYRESSTAPV
jgi:hypothetical protein